MKVLQKYVAVLLAAVLTAACATPNVQTGAPPPPMPPAQLGPAYPLKIKISKNTIRRSENT